jgi:hypothetical protein
LRQIFTPNFTGGWVVAGGSANGVGVYEFDNISVRELPGNHASQATSTARPTLQTDASGHWYLDFDGIDDWLQTANVDMSSKTAFSTFGAVEADSLNFASTWSHGIEYNVPGRWVMQANYRAVIRVHGDFGATDFTFRIDGADGTSASSVATNLRNDPIIIGNYANGFLYYNGKNYGFMIIARDLSPTEISTMETYLANKSGVTL